MSDTRVKTEVPATGFKITTEVKETEAVKKRRSHNLTVLVKPNIEHVIDDAMVIAAMEFQYLREKMLKSNTGLTPSEAATYAKCSDALVKLAREERQRMADVEAEMDTFSDEELAEMALQMHIGLRNDEEE